jgi:Transposase DDE domain
MDTVAQVVAALEALYAQGDELAYCSGFERRDAQTKLSGAQFVATLVCGYLRDPQASRSVLAATAGQLGVPISPQGIDQRLGPAGARLLRAVLGRAARALVQTPAAATPLLDRFPAVYVQDSTVVGLPDTLAAAWPGCGGRTVQGTQAAVKAQVRLELRRGALTLELLAGRAQDQTGALVDDAGEPGCLHLQDLGYFSLARFAAWSATGRYWLSRLKMGVTVVLAAAGTRVAAAWLQAQGAGPVDVAVQVGQRPPLGARLLAARVPPAVAQERRRQLRAAAKREGTTPSRDRLALADWTLLLTNVPPEQLTVAEALVLVGVRWQIELVFKLWKEQGRFEQWQSAKPWAILCELYAKLLGLVVQHWLTLVGTGPPPTRSLAKAARVVARNVGVLLAAWRGRLALALAVTIVADGIDAGCRLERRRRYPSTAQLLADPTLPLPFRPRPAKRRGRKPRTTLQKVA